MNKRMKWNVVLAIFMLLLVGTACSNSNSSVVEDEAVSPSEADKEVEVQEEASEESNTTTEEATEPVELEMTIVKDEKDIETVTQIKQEENVDDAIIFVTDDRYVLATVTFSGEVSESDALTRGEKVSKSLKEKYPDYTIDLEVFIQDTFVEQFIVQ